MTAQAVQVSAEERASIYNVSVGLAGGAGVAVSGSLAVNTIQNTVYAGVTDGSTITATTGDIRITARDTASISALAGNVSVFIGRVAAGMAFAVNRVFDTVYAGAVGSALSAAGDIVVQATFARPDDMPPGLTPRYPPWRSAARSRPAGPAPTWASAARRCSTGSPTPSRPRSPAPPAARP